MAKFERVVLPFREWAPDENFLSSSGNLDSATGLIRLDGAWTRINAPASVCSVATNLFPSAALSWSDETGSNRAVVAYQSHLYAADLAGGTLVDRCKGGHYAAASDWDLLKFGPSVIATNNSDPVQLFNFGAASADLITSTTKPRGKYLCACRGHVILANISSPVANVRQFRWCALNDAANWEPGSNRSGFGELAGDAGVITGAQGFEDFFLLFTNVGVYRASYIGGENVWSIQQVGGWHDALPNNFEETIVPLGRDAYYLGRSGPKVVVNGEAVEDVGVGKVRRYLMDDARNLGVFIEGPGPDTTIPFGSRAWGCFDGFRELVYWGWSTGDINSIGLYVVAYSPIEDSWSELGILDGVNPPSSPSFGAMFARTGSIAMNGSGGNPGFGLCYARSFTANGQIRNLSGSTFSGAYMTSKIWRPSEAKTQICGVRPLWRTLGSLQVPTLNIDVIGDVTTTFTPGSSQEDPRGFLTSDKGPVSGDQFQFRVRIEEVGAPPSAQLRDFVGLELEVNSEKSRT